jgi:F-type H+-transporting ATPase subunit delta
VAPSAILGRFARSLAEVAFEEYAEQKVTEDLSTYVEIFRTAPDLIETFDSPRFSRETKESLLNALLRKYPVHRLTSNFLRILLQHNRISQFEQIQKIYESLVNERKGIAFARVSAAAPLSKAEEANLSYRLTKITGKKIYLEVQTDESLLGGVVIKIGGAVYDGSIKTQLVEMKRRIIET